MATREQLLEAEFQVVEAILFLASFSEGSLDERILALPPRAFAQAAELMRALCWIDL